MLEVSNLMVFFENALALNGLSLTVREGEIVGLIGSNSAGKTTFMNTVSGLIIDMRIKEKRKGGQRISIYGSVTYDGEEITETPPSERVRKGIVLSRERHPVFPESTVVENFKSAGYLRTKSEIRETMDFVFTLFPPFSKLKTRKACFLSGGEQQMLAIGMALVVRPKLLLLDEPLLGLSPMIGVPARYRRERFPGVRQRVRSSLAVGDSQTAHPFDRPIVAGIHITVLLHA
jgi:branched-chain amino acid transport system ATP-binding protein